MITLFLLLAFAILGVKSQITSNPCGYDRTNLLLESSSVDVCASITLKRNCVLANVLNPSATGGSSKKCLWNGNTLTCYTETGAVSNCYPSCFSNNRQYATGVLCSSFNSSTCNSKYVYSNGDYYVCILDNSGACIPKQCDYTCTGPYQPVSTCAGKNQYECPDYYYNSGSVSYNCKVSGSSCVQGARCFPGCDGIAYTTNCSSYNYDGWQCISHYKITGGSGSERINCEYNPVTALCSTGSQYCSLPNTASCTGTYRGLVPCSSLVTATACEPAYVLDGTIRQCHWNYGSGKCNDGDPCN
uniref:Uncharacterized protein n=1 Tax=viral metagenome TaxID=1070528 RepID=A0A6C0C8F7_9ZZZZ